MNRTLPVVAGAGLLVALGLTACPTPPSPKGPSPEYEDPPAPSWLEGGAPTVARDAGSGSD
jgi:hypothetical protein